MIEWIDNREGAVFVLTLQVDRNGVALMTSHGAQRSDPQCAAVALWLSVADDHKDMCVGSSGCISISRSVQR